MSDEALVEIKQKFVGKWKNDRSECFEEFLAAVGVNFLIRKMAAMSRPVSEITVDDEGKITISMVTTFMTKQDSFKLDEEFDTDWQGTKCKNKAVYEDGKIVMDVKPLDENIKSQKTVREILEDGELLLTINIGDVVCKRWFKKLTE